MTHEIHSQIHEGIDAALKAIGAAAVAHQKRDRARVTVGLAQAQLLLYAAQLALESPAGAAHAEGDPAVEAVAKLNARARGRQA